jgi:hypothetical protein
MRQPPEIAVTVLIRRDDSPGGGDARPDASLSVQLSVFCKHHHGDDEGTVDAVALGEIGPRPMQFGDRDAVARQVRAILEENADTLVQALPEHERADGVGADALQFSRLPLEIDLDTELAQTVGDQFPATEMRRVDRDDEAEPTA